VGYFSAVARLEGRLNAKAAKEEYEVRNFALFAWIYPAKQGFALFAVNGFLF